MNRTEFFPSLWYFLFSDTKIPGRQNNSKRTTAPSGGRHVHNPTKAVPPHRSSTWPVRLLALRTHFRYHFRVPRVVNTRGTAEKSLLYTVDFGSSSGLSTFKMANDESKTNKSLSWLLATFLSLKALINNSATFGQSPVQMFWLWSRGSKRCFQFYQTITTAPPRGNFQLFQNHPRNRSSFS